MEGWFFLSGGHGDKGQVLLLILGTFEPSLWVGVGLLGSSSSVVFNPFVSVKCWLEQEARWIDLRYLLWWGAR